MWVVTAMAGALSTTDPRVAAPLPMPAGPAPSAIVNGVDEDGYPTAVGLGALEQTLCTGSVIAPRTVLTAAHCTIDLPIELITTIGRVYLDGVPADDRSLAVVSVAVHPAYERLSNEPGAQTLGAFDLAVLELAEPAPVRPTWIRTEPLTDAEAVGRTLVSVGYGDDGAGNGSRRRSAELVIDRIDSMYLVSRAAFNPGETSICQGDSGGPQFDVAPDGTLVQWGVHSWVSERCSGESGSTRVDVGAAWILEQVARIEGSQDPCDWWGADDGACDAACEDVDPDCAPEPLADARPASLTTAGCAHAGVGGVGGVGALVLMARRRGGRRRA